MTSKRPAAALVLLGGLMASSARADDPDPAPSRRRVTTEMAAHLPAPGTVAPAAVAFAPNGGTVTYLRAESFDSLSRVLWRADVPGGEPRVIARAPGAGDTDENVSLEEALRRERQRQRATGLSQVSRAEAADLAILPIAGDLYLLRGDGPLERLTETPPPEIDPQPSPDASHVAFVREGDLYTLDLGSRRELQLTTGAGDGLSHGLAEFIAQEELDRASGFWWSPDGSTIAYQETDERHIPTFTIAHQGDQVAVEAHRYPFAGAANARVRLGVVPSSGGETRWLTLAEPDREVYLARVQWEDPGHLLVQLLDRDQKRLRLVRIDVESGERTELIEETSETWVDLHDDLRVVEETGELLWSSDRTGSRHLELHGRDGALIRVLTSGDWSVDPLSAHAGLRGVVAVVARRREVWFMANRDGPLEDHLYRVSLDGGPVRKVTTEPGTHRVEVARDGNHFVDTWSSTTRPPLTTIRDRDGAIVTTLHDASDDPRLDKVHLEPPRLTEFRNRDGLTLFGAYYSPLRQGDAKAPLVVMVYGGPTVQTVTNSWSLTADLTSQLLSGRGIAVWKADNRGSSRRGKTFQDPIFGRLGTVEVRDQADGVRFVAASQPEVDMGQVGITGSSYGGYMTLRALTEAPDVFKAGVAIAPVTAWDGYDTAYTERYLGTPAGNPSGYEMSSVLPAAGRLSGDLLVIHGMIDENVHFRHAARLATALIRASRPFGLLPLPDERHSPRREEDRRYVADRLLSFFEAALKR